MTSNNVEVEEQISPLLKYVYIAFKLLRKIVYALPYGITIFTNIASRSSPVCPIECMIVGHITVLHMPSLIGGFGKYSLSFASMYSFDL